MTTGRLPRERSALKHGLNEELVVKLSGSRIEGETRDNVGY
jgi:hypothetical protein